MKSFSLKKSMLMLVALFMLGACSTSPDVTPDDYNTEFIKLIKGFEAVDGYTVDDTGMVLKRNNDNMLFHFKEAASDTSAIYCRHSGEVGLIYEIHVLYTQSLWNVGTEKNNLNEALYLNIVGGYGKFEHEITAGDYKFLEDGKTLYYYSDNNPDWEPRAVSYTLDSWSGSESTATATYTNSGSLYIEVVVEADKDTKATAITVGTKSS